MASAGSVTSATLFAFVVEGTLKDTVHRVWCRMELEDGAPVTSTLKTTF
jgi:hypothetical protein